MAASAMTGGVAVGASAFSPGRPLEQRPIVGEPEITRRALFLLEIHGHRAEQIALGILGVMEGCACDRGVTTWRSVVERVEQMSVEAIAASQQAGPNLMTSNTDDSPPEDLGRLEPLAAAKKPRKASELEQISDQRIEAEVEAECVPCQHLLGEDDA